MLSSIRTASGTLAQIASIICTLPCSRQAYTSALRLKLGGFRAALLPLQQVQRDLCNYAEQLPSEPPLLGRSPQDHPRPLFSELPLLGHNPQGNSNLKEANSPSDPSWDTALKII